MELRFLRDTDKRGSGFCSSEKQKKPCLQWSVKQGIKGFPPIFVTLKIEQISQFFIKYT